MSRGDCETALRFAQLAAEEQRSDISFLIAMKEGGVKKCETTDVFVFFEVLYLSAVSRDM